jgi:serine/threonine protein kinase
MVYEFCNGGTLHDLIKKKDFLTEKESLNVLEQICIAFKEMNSHDILHRDLKP